MVKFIDVDPTELDDTRTGRRGRVSYPILKSFLETGKFLVMLDRTGMQQSVMGLSSALNSYIRNHQMPIKLFTRSGQIYLMRLDVDKEGNPIPNWLEEMLGAPVDNDDMEVLEITPEVVGERFQEEKDKATK